LFFERDRSRGFRFIAQQIARAHGGTIEVESSAKDRTTTFTVRLPRSV
jgi:signal transduction histidine kinase